MTHTARALAFSVSVLPILAGALLSAHPVSFYEGRTAYPAIGTVALATGDFNGDGIADSIAAVAFGVAVYPGRLTGDFQAPITTTLPATCSGSLLAVDFNGDGKLDFTCLLPNGFQVSRGNGDGTFSAPVTYISSGIKTLVSADFNGDGVADLATFTPSAILVYFGKGDGTFLPPVVTPDTQGSFTSMHAADIDGDGKTDLVMTRANTVAVLIGTGTGSFNLPLTTSLKAGSADSVTTGDLNGDGNLDIVVAINQAASDFPIPHIAVLLQKANRKFLPSYYATPNPLSQLALADVNGDGLLDVIGLRRFGAPAITILEGAAGGTLGSPLPYEVPATAYRIANPRHNAVPDIIYTDSNTIVLLPNRGNGVFVPGVQVSGGVSSSPCLAGDFNNDGLPDLACLDSYVIDVLYGTGVKNQPFADPLVIQLIGPASSIALGDFNSDGNLDITAALIDQSIQYIENQGASGFVQVAHRSPGGPKLNVLATGDFNGDGKLDLVTGDGNFLAGNGDGTFQPPVSFYPGQFQYFAAADLNGDGKLDLVGVAGGEAPPVLLFGLGNGTFSSAVLTGVKAGYSPVIADLNGDGMPDIVFPAALFGVNILLNTGRGQFVSAPSIFNDFWPPTVSVAVGDFNGDGKPDIVFGTQSSAVFPVTGNGDGTFGATANGFSVEDATSLRTIALQGAGSANLSLAAGSSVITVLESR